jgi:hypothetical protein
LEEFPDKPQVNVLFTDINSDGVLEAIATSYGEHYEDGNTWTIFQRSGLSWVPVKLKMKDATTVDPSSSLLARGDEFYLLTGSGGKRDLTVIHKLSPITSKCTTCDHFKVHHFGWVFF